MILLRFRTFRLACHTCRARHKGSCYTLHVSLLLLLLQRDSVRVRIACTKTATSHPHCGPSRLTAVSGFTSESSSIARLTVLIDLTVPCHHIQLLRGESEAQGLNPGTRARRAFKLTNFPSVERALHHTFFRCGSRCGAVGEGVAQSEIRFLYWFTILFNPSSCG